MRISCPRALFDQLPFFFEADQPFVLEYLGKIQLPRVTETYRMAHRFLHAYSASPDTFNAYRREVERFLHWLWLIKQTTIDAIVCEQVADYLRFMQKPPKNWMMTHSRPRFMQKDGIRQPDPAWRPFWIRPYKSNAPIQHSFSMHANSIASAYAALSSFYNFLLQERFVTSNPVKLLRQKKQYLGSSTQHKVIRRLSKLQWQTLIDSTEKRAAVNQQYERHLFLLTLFFLLGVRISEVSTDGHRIPIMGDFYPDSYDNWWFQTTGKGNKYREIAVPDECLTALVRYRQTLGLHGLPMRGESTPLIGKIRGMGGLTARQVRNLVQDCFNETIATLRQQGDVRAADDMQQATVHWLRHTAISFDVERNRPLTHIGDDAGHRHTNTTSQYIDIDRRLRHDSAKTKSVHIK